MFLELRSHPLQPLSFELIDRELEQLQDDIFYRERLGLDVMDIQHNLEMQRNLRRQKEVLLLRMSVPSLQPLSP
jgi:hypothetical protein